MRPTNAKISHSARPICLSRLSSLSYSLDEEAGAANMKYVWQGGYGLISVETEALKPVAACRGATSGKGARWTPTGVADVEPILGIEHNVKSK
jgi:hypothetical protein